MGNKKLKADKYLEYRKQKLMEERDTLEEKMKEGRIEIQTLEEELKEIEKEKDNVGDIFQAKSTDYDPATEMKKDTEDKIETLYSANTNYISAIKKIENEIKVVKEIEEEITSICKEKEEYKEKFEKTAEEKKELLSKTENSQKENGKEEKYTIDNNDYDNKCVKETNDNKAKNENIKKEVDIEEEKKNKEIINQNVDVIINRLEFCKALIGKDNQRATLLLSQMIDKIQNKKV